MACKIREATPGDMEIIVSFQQQMAYETEQLTLDPEILSAGVKAVFDSPEKGRYFVAEMENTVVASLMITYEWSDWRNGQVWWFQSVYVRPEFRRQNVFKEMYLYIQNYVVNDAQIRGLRLYVDNQNHRAQQVYEALGMNGGHYRVFEWMKLDQ